MYGPTRNTSTYYDALSQNLADFSANKIIVGYFNVVLDVWKDRLHSSFNHQNSQRSLFQLMEDYQLNDLWRVRNKDQSFFSWRRPACNQGSRIDFALVSEGFDTKCDNITYIPGIESDHSAIFLSIKDISTERGPGFWKMNINHLQSETLKQNVRNEIIRSKKCQKNVPPDEKWEYIKGRVTKILKAHARNAASDQKLLIGQLTKLIDWYESNFPLPKTDNETYLKTKEDLHQLVTDRARSVVFHSGARWTECGEKKHKVLLQLRTF